jgi:hypothetical protein
VKEAAMKHTPKRDREAKKEHVSLSLLERIQPDAAGIDCGQNSHFVAVPPDRDSQPVREFRTFTGELHRLAEWLAQCGVKTVAMESTGVYWIALYEILEQRDVQVVLVNARDVHNVPGRKSDVQDCEWLRELSQRRAVTSQLPAQRRHRAAARLSAPARNLGPGDLDSHSPHAEGPDRDECHAPRRSD